MAKCAFVRCSETASKTWLSFMEIPTGENTREKAEFELPICVHHAVQLQYQAALRRSARAGLAPKARNAESTHEGASDADKD